MEEHTQNQAIDFEMEAQKVMTLAQLALAMDIDFEYIAHAVTRADTLGPILIPTEWNNSTEDYRLVGDMAEHLREFVKLAEGARREVQKRTGAD